MVNDTKHIWFRTIRGFFILFFFKKIVLKPFTIYITWKYTYIYFLTRGGVD